VGNGKSVQASTVERCFNTGSIVSAKYAGGVVGGFTSGNSNITLRNCENYGLVEGVSGTGGIVGSIEYNSTTVQNCFNSGVVKNQQPATAGCIIGSNQGGTVRACHFDKQMCTYSE
jgi:hypothetical protein